MDQIDGQSNESDNDQFNDNDIEDALHGIEFMFPAGANSGQPAEIATY